MTISTIELPNRQADTKVFLFINVGVIAPIIRLTLESWETDEEMEREIDDYHMARDIHALNVGESCSIEGSMYDTIIRLQ